MGTHTYSASGAEGEQALAALGEHLPAGVMATPMVVSDGAVLDEEGGYFQVDAAGARRLLALSGGGIEVTCWRRGREVSRQVELDPPGGGPR